jgi:hypothetical protein
MVNNEAHSADCVSLNEFKFLKSITHDLIYRKIIKLFCLEKVIRWRGMEFLVTSSGHCKKKTIRIMLKPLTINDVRKIYFDESNIFFL